MKNFNEFKKEEIGKTNMSIVFGGLRTGGDPCCSVTIYADGKPARTDDEDCQEEVAASVSHGYSATRGN
ncbi:hypothetical protein SAMN04489761_3952 [Tenacibaculum sp. MAR_2009_124]|uniref:hypothetical protein n=1 Tax=Tenacibaculum sp. MAR_2009_124 TaxID=1250059 RepID=UPI000899E878|nr:hypothetical protein [Tenacibaculum sp. MAR_2009_124]SEC91543.1 hypothetical protein SAMN04489761_3952 [Tenacibaculum sp. MAR_2009_124]